MLIRPIHYTIEGRRLKSWLVEGSLDGESWTEIDRQTDRTVWSDSGDLVTSSFTVSTPMECRFIRLTQIGKNSYPANQWDSGVGQYRLRIRNVEFFGTLYE
jgi:hypothetical protein